MADAVCQVEFFIVCELLCYLQNNFANSTYEGLLTAISGFFYEQEIVDAKNKLYDVMKRVYTDDPHLNVEDLPRQTTRRAGDNKRRNDTRDIIDLYKLLDALDTDFPLPIFTAAFLKRLPPFQPDATDFCSLASSVEFLQFQMADVLKRLKSLGHAGSGVGIAGSRHSGGGAGSGVGGAIGMGSSFSSNNNHAEVESMSMDSIELSGGRLPVGNPGG